LVEIKFCTDSFIDVLPVFFKKYDDLLLLKHSELQGIYHDFLSQSRANVSEDIMFQNMKMVLSEIILLARVDG
jgi:hypothetical protein